MPERRFLRYWSKLYVSPDKSFIETKPPKISLDYIPLRFKTGSVLDLVTGLYVMMLKEAVMLFFSALAL